MSHFRQTIWRVLPCVVMMLVTGFHCEADAALTQVAGCTFEADGGGDRADIRGVRFTLSEDFQALELVMSASEPGIYVFTAEVRRSSGFTGDPLRSRRFSVELPGGYAPKILHMDFTPISVGTSETFTFKFKEISGPGIMYLDVIHDTDYCSDVEMTDDTTSANPEVRFNDPWLRVLGQGQASELSMTSSYASHPPTLDGFINFGEWPTGNKLELENGFITVTNDRHRLYVLIDVLEDGQEEDDDYFWLTFDVNQDAEITPYLDLNFGINPRTGEMRYSYYTAPATWTGMQPETYSSMGEGFGCFFGDGTLFYQINPFSVTCSRHRVWELGIDLAEIGARAGGTARIGLKISSASPAFSESLPNNFTVNFTNLIEVDLATPNTFIFLPDPGESLGFDQGAGTDPVEVNQAIQDRGNTLLLVQDKKSVARVYTQSESKTQPGIVSLYGSQNGIDLPGSPLAVFHHSPVSIDRENIYATANFELPKTWTRGDVTFRAVVRDLFSRPVSSENVPLTFHQAETPNYWVVPLNTGTAATPVLPDNDDINNQQAFTKAIYPVPHINFTRKSWEAIGPTTINDAIDDLNYFYSVAVLGWIFSGFSFDLPDQLYGVTKYGGGVSDPAWCGGISRVARGGTANDTIMAHEIIHNLGPGDCAVYPGCDLWGRHVSNLTSGMANGYCIPGDTTTYGCGATGADAGWQARYDDAEIHEVGVDTSVSPFRIIPADKPEVMSYCDDTELPSSWISDYRWERMFDFFQAGAAKTSVSSAQYLQERVQTTIYVNGLVFSEKLGGGGELNPAMVQPGIPMTQDEVTPGIYALELWPERGEKPLYVLQFNAYFGTDNARERPDNREKAPFSFRLPEIAGTDQIRLTKIMDGKPLLLDIIEVDYSSPTVEILSPNYGTTWRGKEIVKWSAFDKDSDLLSFTIFYSQDMGKNWRPMSGRLERENRLKAEYSFEMDTATLPAGSDRVRPTCLIRIIATDGYNTTQQDSEAFFVAPNSPEVHITAPGNLATFVEGEMITFQGSAWDQEDGDIPEAQMVWSYGGNPFGTGSQVQAALPAGTHDITLTAMDADGQAGTAAISISIVSDCVWDFNSDGDVDGADLALFVQQGSMENLEAFAGEFGKIDCRR